MFVEEGGETDQTSVKFITLSDMHTQTVCTVHTPVASSVVFYTNIKHTTQTSDLTVSGFCLTNIVASNFVFCFTLLQMLVNKMLTLTIINTLHFVLTGADAQNVDSNQHFVIPVLMNKMQLELRITNTLCLSSVMLTITCF